MRRVLLLCLLFLTGCHPLSCTHPPELPPEGTLEFRSGSTAFPQANVRAYVDENGVPHIFGESEADLAYGLGFFHAKDRLWQLITTRAGIFGRLTELLGEDYLDSDRGARMLVYGVEEQFANLTARDKRLMEAYAAGVNDGAFYAGPTAEMRLAQVEFQPFQAIEALGIARFLGWRLSSGLSSELARNRIMARLDENDPRRAELLAVVDTLGVPVVRAEDHSGLTNYLPDQPGMQAQTASPKSAPRRVSRDAPSKGPPRLVPNDFVKALSFAWDESGASNVWAVSGEHTDHGAPVLAHDPHLGHSAPGLFYLAHLEHRDFTLAGGSVAGTPGILLGHGRHVSWGTPVSNVDSQDLVRITPYEGRDDLYLLDGEPKAYETLTQTYKLGSAEDAPVFEEEWKITVFGPVLPASYDDQQEEGDIFALMWPGHKPLSNEGRIISSLWDVGQANNLEEAEIAIQGLTSPPITMGMAFDDGTIAYRLSGDIPVRRSTEPVGFPRDGRSSDAGWATFLPKEYKPQITNPARGFLVAANQKIVEEDGPQASIIGREGTLPYRAKRITERLEELIADGNKATTEEIFQIQQDVTSVEARAIAPVMAAHCPDDVSGVDAGLLNTYCSELASFDAVFDLDSIGATVWTRTWRQLLKDIMVLHLGEDAGNQVRGQSFIQSALWRAIVAFGEGQQPAILDNPDTAAYEGLAPFMKSAAKTVIDGLVEQQGEDTAQWRWGATHTFAAKGQLASLPVVGALWVNERHEETGCHHCVRAERGNDSGEVTNGAVLRISAEMTDPPTVRVINDTGQSGHFGHRHSYDLNPRWREGDPLLLAIDEDEARERAEGKVLFLTRTGGDQ